MAQRDTPRLPDTRMRAKEPHRKEDDPLYAERGSDNWIEAAVGEDTMHLADNQQNILRYYGPVAEVLP